MVAHKENAEPTDRTLPPLYDEGALLLCLIERRLSDLTHPSHYVGPDELNRALKANADKPLPPIVDEYARDMREGRVNSPRGRGYRGGLDKLCEVLIVADYRRRLAWLRQRRRSIGLKGWSGIRDAGWWQGAPHARAAKMTACRWGKRFNMGYRRILNLASEDEYRVH